MKKIILVVIFFLIFSSLLSLHAQWVKTYGKEVNDRVFLLQQTNDGGCIVAGKTRLTWGVYYTVLLVMKLDSNGTIEWQKTFRSGYGDEYDYLSIQQTSDGGCIFSAYTDDIPSYMGEQEFLVVKLGSTGNIDTSGSFSLFTDGLSRFMQNTSDGGYILTGNTLTSGPSGDDVWILRLSPLREIEWQRAYGGNSYDSACSVQQTGDGGYILIGNTTSYGAGGEDIWIIKLSQLGDIEWQKAYGGIDSENACSIQQTSDGGYILIGDTWSFGAGDEDILIIKLTQSGDIGWQRTYGGTDIDAACSIQETSDGGYVVGGNTSSFGAAEKNGWILKLSQTGTVEWEKTLGNSFGEINKSVQQSIDGGYISASSISSFGAGSSDFLIFRLLSDGTVNLPCRFIQDSSAEVSDIFITLENTDGIAVDINITREIGELRSLYEDYINATVYELCSLNPLLTIHSTNGGITDPDPGTYIRNPGDEVDVTAIPDSGAEFTGWSGDATGTVNPIAITLDSDKSITANFFIHEYTLYITTGEGGTTDPEPGIHKDAPGTDIVVTAIPEGGYQFSEWSGDVTGTENPITITLDSNKSVTANFTEISDEGSDIFRINCFIATAAYGSPYHHHVEVLRDFRDEYLMNNKLGRQFVNLYYKYSPYLAKFIAKHKALKTVTQLYLLPPVAFSFLMLQFGPIITAIMFVCFFSSVFLFSYWRRKIKDQKSKMVLLNNRIKHESPRI
ncbi:MAG: hypothetical protein KAT69_03560 [Candidatus Aminicenantes bacterium]|nr:hypothetical protein [Candidatus Aminicenantes bacterium]